MPFDISATERNLTRLKSQEQDLDDIVNKIRSEFEQSQKVLNSWKQDIVRYYELYSLTQKRSNYEGLAHIFVPEILRAVETIVAKLYQMIFSDPNWFEYCDRDGEYEGPAEALTQLVFYQMDENNFKARIMDTLRQMVIAGLCVRKIGWDYQEVNRIVGTDDNGKPKRQLDTIKDTWTLEPVDLLTFHISDITVPYNDVQKAEWMGEEYLVEKNWVRERTKRGWLSDSQKTKLEEDNQAPDSQVQNLINNRFRSSGFIAQDEKQKKVHILERWGLCPASWVMDEQELQDEGYDPEDMVESIIIIGNKKAILKLEKNPWYHQQKPYVVCPYIPKEFELPGLGAAKVGESLQEEINDTRNQVMDNKTLILSTMWLKTRGSGIKEKDLVIRPNAVITTNDIEGLQPLRPPVVAGIGTNMEGIAKDDLRESVGAASNLQGIAQAGVGTATEASTINRESVGRLMLTAQLFCELVLKPTFLMAEFLNYQFYDHIKVISVVGKVGIKYKQLGPEDIKGGHKDVIIKVSLDATENPAIQRQQLMNLLTIMQGIPPQMVPFYWKLLDKIYGQFFHGHSLDELFPAPPELQNFLNPEEERDLVIASKPVVAQEGQDHNEYLQYLVPQFKSMQHSLDELQFELFKKLIESHLMMRQKDLQKQQQAMLQQQMMMAQENQGNMIDRGRTRNSTPFNQTGAPSTESLRKGIGG